MFSTDLNRNHVKLKMQLPKIIYMNCSRMNPNTHQSFNTNFICHSGMNA